MYSFLICVYRNCCKLYANSVVYDQRPRSMAFDLSLHYLLLSVFGTLCIYALMVSDNLHCLELKLQDMRDDG